ncbi:helix-turn-helix domain-containing protein [Micromonospora noduli]|uniref:helix-turn-helix domain-containing protein n=1 Tax=Micromonospora noduli TaxID=709876 RepID=UPI00124B433F|nr:helix-turn-helix transcriptional regulator [Micromonospora noduli]KAB1917335.1 helix-turn-helix domain-containing protein [Micromonospora noduli]
MTMPPRSIPPADPESGQVAQFGFDLRQLRQQAGMTYAAIAQSNYYSPSTVHAVDQGHQLPSEALLKAFVKACGGDPATWLARRVKIHDMLAVEKRATRTVSPRDAGMDPPDPTEASTKIEYNDALKKLREWSGMTFRRIAEISEAYPRRVPASTLCNAFQRGTLPARGLTESFLQAVGLDEAQRATWLKTWDDIDAGRPVKTEPAWRRWRTGAQSAIVRPHPADLTPVMPAMPYSPTNDVREWVLVDGEWRAADEAGNVTERERLPMRNVAAASLLMAFVVIGMVILWAM